MLFVRRTMWSTPFSRATSIVRSVEPSSMISHSTVSKPAHLARQVAQRDGEGLLLVQAGDLDDELHRAAVGRYRVSLPSSPAWTVPIASRRPPSRCCASAAWSASSSTRPIPTTTRTTRCCGAARCSTCRRPTFEGFRVPTEHPLAIVAGAALSLLGDAGDRVWVALIIASYLWLVAGVYRLGKIAFTPLVGRDRRRAAADALRLRVPDRARLHRHPLHGDGRVGGGAGGASGRAAARPCSCCSRWRGCCGPRRGCWRPCTGAGSPGPRAGAQRALYAVLAAAGPVLWAATDFAVTGDPLFSLHYTSTSAEELGRNLPLSQLPVRDPGVLREPRQAAGAGRGGARPRRSRSWRSRAARRRRSRCSPRGSSRSC